MARYLMVVVDDNDVADRLVSKLNERDGMRVVGLYGKPTKFCDGTCQAGEVEPRSLKGAKYGWWVCPVCKRAKRLYQVPRNLLDIEDLPVRFLDCFLELRINEPYDNDPVGKYGETAIEGQRRQNEVAREKLIRWQRGAERRTRRKEARARRRSSNGVKL